MIHVYWLNSRISGIINMNMFDSCFLCLDIGTSGVRGIAHHVKSGEIAKSATISVDSFDTIFAIKSVIYELEHMIGRSLDSAYITGNFGPSVYKTVIKSTVWSGEHKITQVDIRNQLSQIETPDEFQPVHIVPLVYSRPGARDMLNPVGSVDRQLVSVFGSIFYRADSLDNVYSLLRHAYISPIAFYDPQFLQNAAFRKTKQNTMFIDFGAEYTSASIWTKRGPVFHTKIKLGGTNITNEICKKFNLGFDDAERIKKTVASLIPKEMDRFTPADMAYDFSRSDINEIITPIFIEIIHELKNTCAETIKNHTPTKIIATGGGAEIEGLGTLIENTFNITTQTLSPDTTVRALSDYIWKIEEPHRKAFLSKSEKWTRRLQKITKLFAKRPKKRPKIIPILPSTLCFNMSNPETYALFKSGGISMIHVDIMDGFYVDKVESSIEELRKIRSYTKSHLHVHLMTESPKIWASDAIAAGADTVILSTNTSGLRAAIKIVRAAGKRVGIALNPNSSVLLLKGILREIDEVMIMSVTPGAAGQQFDPGAIHKISVLNATRKKFKLNFTISVDGGINDKTAALCWKAGADMLICGSYLARAHDFPLAVQSLLKKESTK